MLSYQLFQQKIKGTPCNRLVVLAISAAAAATWNLLLEKSTEDTDAENQERSSDILNSYHGPKINRSSFFQPLLNVSTSFMVPSSVSCNGIFLNAPQSAPTPTNSSAASSTTKQRVLDQRVKNVRKRITNATSRQRLNSLYKVNWDAPLGEGGYGAVYAATNRRTGEKVACKKMSKKITNDIGFQREMEAFFHLRENGGHPNICTLHETFDEGDHYYLIMDLISGGEMFDHLINNGPYSEADAARLMREIASALAFMHGIGCIHADLKPENIMLSTTHASDAVVKLIDFGCSQVVAECSCLPPSVGNTWAFCPPEYLSRNPADVTDDDKMDPKMDMWALGCILYIMLVGGHPFDLAGDAPDDAIALRVIRSRKEPPQLVNSPVTAHLSDSAKDLIQKLLAFDPQNRLSAIEMLEHPWVRGETASKDKIVNSDKRLSKFRVFKSGLEAKVFADLFNWSQESAEDVKRKTSLFERSFQSFDEQHKGFVTSRDLKRRLQGDTSTVDDGEEETPLSLSAFSEMLSDHMKNRYFPRGHTVYQEGQVGNEMFFINSGVLEVSTQDGFRSILKQGDFVGEGALLNPERTRAATLKCVTPVHAIEISREYFEKYILASKADINLKMREKAKSRALDRAKALLGQQKLLKPLEVTKGRTLYQAGDNGDSLFILEEGMIDARAGKLTVMSFKPGDIVGVTAVLGNRKHSTSAVCASKKCKLQVLGASDFHRILHDLPKLEASLKDVNYRREFQEAVIFHTKKPFPTSPDELREVFDVVDQDKNGTISLDEVRSMLKGFYPSCPEEEIQAIMKSLDIDGSNVVSFEEFKVIFGMETMFSSNKY